MSREQDERDDTMSELRDILYALNVMKKKGPIYCKRLDLYLDSENAAALLKTYEESAYGARARRQGR